MSSEEETTLLQAINALYHNTDRKVKEDASRWLESWQQSPGAWNLSDRLLHASGGNVEVDYFCANTLKLKVQRDFEELPEGAAVALRDSLIRLLLRAGASAPPVRMQLCLALAALAAHLPAAQWGARGCVGWLVDVLSGQEPDVAMPVMLEMLVVLPQESGSYRPAIRPERRRQLVEEVKAQLPMAMAALNGCLADGKHTRQVLEAFAAWLKLTGAAGLDGNQLGSQPLVAAALRGLGEPDNFEHCVEVLCELVACTQADGTLVPHMAPLAQLLVGHVLQLRPRFSVASARLAAERAGHTASGAGAASDFDDDEDSAKGMARLFAELGEAFVQLIAAGTPELTGLVDALLEVAAFPDDIICAISFNFWAKLAHALTSNFTPQPIGAPGANGTEGSVPAEEQRRRLALFAPHFERLVLLIRGRVAYPRDYDSWHRDEKADFRRSRYAIGDTLLDAGKVLGAERLMELLVQPLQQLSERCAAGEALDWRAAEAGLYCIRAVHRVAPPPSQPLLRGLFSGLPALPREPALQYTVAMLVGSYASWLAQGLQQDGATAPLLPLLLQLLAQGFAERDVAPAAALALRNVAEECAEGLVPSLPSLMEVYSSVQGSGAAGGDSSPLKLDEEDVLQVMEAVCCVASALPAQQRSGAVTALLGPLLAQLQGLLSGLQAAAGGGGDAVLEPALVLVDRIAVVLRYTSEPHAVAAALSSAWPALDATAAAFGGDARAPERVSRCMRYALRTAGKACASLLPLLLSSLPTRFSTSRHSAYLYVASELLKIFGDEPQRAGDLGAMLASMLREANSQLPSLREYDARPDLADDMFLLAGRALVYCPAIVMTSELLPTLLDAAATGVLVQHREACSSILLFLVRVTDRDLLRKAGPHAPRALGDAFGPRAERLLRLLLAGVAGALPTSREDKIADVVFAVVQATQQQGVAWFQNVLSSVPDVAALPSDRDKFMATLAAVAGGSQDRRSVEAAVEELSEVFRRNTRASNAAQLSLLPPDLHWVVGGH